MYSQYGLYVRLDHLTQWTWLELSSFCNCLWFVFVFSTPCKEITVLIILLRIL